MRAGSNPVAGDPESVLSLAVREAVTNVVRHAHAARCRLELKTNDGVCRLSIQDDGLGGFQPEGNGLTGMRQRVEALGGTLKRETQGARGCTLPSRCRDRC